MESGELLNISSSNISYRMFLHAHRLVVETRLESIDVTAEDSFVHSNFSDWRPLRTICDISVAYKEMLRDTSPWRIITED